MSGIFVFLYGDFAPCRVCYDFKRKPAKERPELFRPLACFDCIASGVLNCRATLIRFGTPGLSFYLAEISKGAFELICEVLELQHCFYTGKQLELVNGFADKVVRA